MNNWQNWDYSNDSGPLPSDALVEWIIFDEGCRDYELGTVSRVDELSWDYDMQNPEWNIVKYRKIILH